MRRIEADIKNEKGPLNRFFSDCVGAGRAGEMLRKTAVDQMEEVQKGCGFRYLRFHGLFAEDMGVYQKDEQGNAVYNWQYVDQAYDAILDSGMKPFVELSFMPHDMASGTQEVFWWKANVTPPIAMDDWYDLVHAFTIHVTERYGEDEVKSWRFEVWNEPNHPAFFSEGLKEYLELYDAAVRGVKDVCEMYLVGGPATAGCAWIPEFLEHCRENKVPVDFVTTHTYGVRGDFDQDGKKILYLMEEKDCIRDSVKAVYDQVKKSAFPDIPIYFTEWSASYSSRDAIHDHYIEASYILYHLKQVEGYVDAMSYWTFTDVFEEVGIGPEPFHGGFGLMNLQSYKKPAYHAYWMLNQLGKTELKQEDSDCYVCKNEDGDIQILWWEYELPKQDACNNEYFKRELPLQSSDKIKICLKNLAMGDYHVSLFQTGYGVHDAYTEYLHRNKTVLTRNEENQIREKTQETPVSESTVSVSDNGIFEMELSMRKYDCFLLLLKKMKS